MLRCVIPSLLGNWDGEGTGERTGVCECVHTTTQTQFVVCCLSMVGQGATLSGRKFV